MSNQQREFKPKKRGMGQGPMGHGGMAPGEKAKDAKGTFKKLMKYIGVYKIGFIVVFLFAIGSTVFTVIGPKILGEATDEIFTGFMRKLGGGSGIDFGIIGRIIVFLIGLYVASAIFSFIQGWIVTGVTQKITYRMRREMSEKICRLPMRYFDKMTHGEVLSRFTNDVDTLGTSLNQSLTQIVTSICALIGIAIMMLTISPLLTLITVLILPISVLLMGIIMKKSQKHFVAQQANLGHVNGQVEEIFGGHNVVKLFNGEEKALEDFNKVNKDLYESAWKSQFLSGTMMPIMSFVGNLGYVAVAVFGAFLMIKGRIQLGDIQAFIQYVKNFTQPISQIAQVSNMFQSTMAAAERVFEFLQEEEEDVTVENPVSIEGLEGNVRFNHVKFGYDPEKTIINDFSCDVKQGQKVAIVGPTGAG